MLVANILTDARNRTVFIESVMQKWKITTSVNPFKPYSFKMDLGMFGITLYFGDQTLS